MEKIKYIKNMRLDLCHEDMVHKETGLLNLQYFNVKKGSYWSPHLTSKLKEMVCLYGAYNSKYCVYSVIKRHKFPKDQTNGKYDKLNKAYEKWFKPFEQIEIQLRICRLLKVVDLTVYDAVKFSSPE